MLQRWPLNQDRHKIRSLWNADMKKNGKNQLEVTNEEVLRRVNEDRQTLNSIWQRKYRWILRQRIFYEITESRMRRKPTRVRRIQMLHDLANDDGSVALKRAAEDWEGWRHRERMSNTRSIAEDCWTELSWIIHSTLILLTLQMPLGTVELELRFAGHGWETTALTIQLLLLSLVPSETSRGETKLMKKMKLSLSLSPF